MLKKYLISKLLFIIIAFFMLFSSTSNISSDKPDYFFELDIPKINLNQKIYNYNSLKNDLSYSVKLLTDINYISKKTIVLAGHSGSGDIAFFNDLYLLNKGDNVIIKYNNIEYNYEVIDIYEIEKTGYMKISTEEIGLLYLVTCKNYVNNKQIVYKAILKT